MGRALFFLASFLLPFLPPVSCYLSFPSYICIFFFLPFFPPVLVLLLLVRSFLFCFFLSLMLTFSPLPHSSSTPTPRFVPFSFSFTYTIFSWFASRPPIFLPFVFNVPFLPACLSLFPLHLFLSFTSISFSIVLFLPAFPQRIHTLSFSFQPPPLSIVLRSLGRACPWQGGSLAGRSRSVSPPSELLPVTRTARPLVGDERHQGPSP